MLLLIAFNSHAAAQDSTASYRDCPDCPEMLNMVAGHFLMGSDQAENETPAHKVEISGFAIGKFPVTRGEFALFAKDSGYDTGKTCFTFEDGKWQKRNPRNWRAPGFPQTDEHPAVCINWNDAQAYTAWLSNKTGKTYRLLTEAEWEYAARAGTTAQHYWGDSADQACEYANVADLTAKLFTEGISWETHQCSDGSIYTSPVGKFQPNAFGLYDMLGNAWQWTADCYDENYQQATKDGTVRTTNACIRRTMRGGAWSGSPAVVRSAKRNQYNPEGRFNFIGFRIARDLNTH